ncbi:MAG: sigma-54-dependent Fis family transcriptional regulator [Planctomycetaceae bacterium]|nr:sigma-54-dependent Fis family transcriptional regulator [Planctomycetales bacterium]MCB9926537.1 sigma-54-dependent Fis family transcriptional regulator [Planctomycetaceae bacterium]
MPIATPYLLQSAVDARDLSDWWATVLPLLAKEFDCKTLAVIRSDKGEWVVDAATGPKLALPVDLLAESLDRRVAINSANLLAGTIPEADDLLLLAELKEAPSAKLIAHFEQLLAEAAMARKLVEQREHDRSRIERLQAILDIAAQWNRTLKMEELLQTMAETSTRLLNAERASIFLWDRTNKMLVGRPALGVEGGELRIADTTGIVGQVIHSGKPARVDRHEQDEIDRGVDNQLGFHTRTLLCVPLVGGQGRMLGAFEMINKRDGEFTDSDEEALIELAGHAAIALENTHEHEQLVKVRNQAADEGKQGSQLIGECAAIEALRSTIRRVSNTDLAVLILGENGTGKEVVSKRIHYLSSRRNEPFIAVNCAALTETLLESELFGHEKGAFTDAHEMRPGKFELSSGGTLFLDEIGDMSLSGQAKLLRVLEEKVVVRVGGSLPIHTDARVIAATNQKLAELVRAKKFREDLYFRLNVVTLELPPLRDRGEDIVMLAEHFLHEFSLKARRRPPEFTAAARKRLLKHNWPGNVRELRNLMERIAYLSQDDKVDIEELAFILSPASDDDAILSLDLPLTDATKHFQVEYIKKQIERSRGSMTEAAERLGLHRSNLYRKMKQLDMPTTDQET